MRPLRPYPRLTLAHAHYEETEINCMRIKEKIDNAWQLTDFYGKYVMTEEKYYELHDLMDKEEYPDWPAAEKTVDSFIASAEETRQQQQQRRLSDIWCSPKTQQEIGQDKNMPERDISNIIKNYI